MVEWNSEAVSLDLMEMHMAVQNRVRLRRRANSIGVTTGLGHQDNKLSSFPPDYLDGEFESSGLLLSNDGRSLPLTSTSTVVRHSESCVASSGVEHFLNIGSDIILTEISCPLIWNILLVLCSLFWASRQT
ncbi:unnamed protein product [Protopolystoma xenopodis]|uniref:Uncharacterized protein n=1 Tax=Protopolystoma xenopodis TaxID=117903 RepID=A0A448XJY4_9PLAT|nr:unnamed protein product [Protopolystoma xenopodis]